VEGDEKLGERMPPGLAEVSAVHAESTAAHHKVRFFLFGLALSGDHALNLAPSRSLRCARSRAITPITRSEGTCTADAECQGRGDSGALCLGEAPNRACACSSTSFGGELCTYRLPAAHPLTLLALWPPLVPPWAFPLVSLFPSTQLHTGPHYPGDASLSRSLVPFVSRRCVDCGIVVSEPILGLVDGRRPADLHVGHGETAPVPLRRPRRPRGALHCRLRRGGRQPGSNTTAQRLGLRNRSRGRLGAVGG